MREGRERRRGEKRKGDGSFRRKNGGKEGKS